MPRPILATTGHRGVKFPVPRPVARALFSVALVLCCGSAGFPQPANRYQGIEETLPMAVDPQPIPFSHRKHSQKGITCLDCHRAAKTSERAGIPQPQQCMLCHVTVAAESPLIRRLASLRGKQEKLDWIRVYRLPDFIFFSHASHLRAGEQCARCHGPVEKREVLAKEISTSMTTCMNCHATREVSTECFLCHDLGQ